MSDGADRPPGQHDDHDDDEKTGGASIPILRDRVSRTEQLRLPTPLPDEVVAELQTELASRVYELTDDLLHAALKEMESALFRQVSDRLREELPELMEQTLDEVLGRDRGEDD